ncbi:MAG: SIMPL domain-containing protein [Veillonella sp.]|jgi:uncharacterized protein YggE|nr:SIMPL domain-containing protein [Veillonella sp.]
MNKLFKKYVLRAAVIGSLAVGLCGSAMAATPATAPEQGQISVSASASRTISPTYALLSLGISTSAADVGQAKVENDRVMSAVVSRLQALGVTKNNIKTSYFNVNPQYDYSANNGGANKVKGYTVTNRVTVRINDLNNVSKIIDGTVNAGATSVDSLQFNADITPDLTDQLITEAVKSGRHQADVVAAAAGEQVGKLKSANVTTNSTYSNDVSPRLYKVNAVALSSSTPIEKGDITVTQNVDLVFTIQ